MKLWTVSDLAEMWQVSDAHVAKMIKRGELVPITLGSGRGAPMRFTSTEVARVLGLSR